MQKNKTNSGPESARIRVLVDSVARRIAAGEVIDRPYSVVRELLDNAIDADSSDIHLEIESGGIQSITCTDNGTGMGAEDLKLSVLPHATSKIREFDDLYNLSTLGFRGEALSSIAACSRLEILSRREEIPEAYRLRVHGGKVIEMREDRGTRGTRVEVQDLFYSLPGRKKFLKSKGAEGGLCTAAFIEKAIPFPEIQFRLFNNSKLKLFLPKGTLRERILNAYPRILDPGLTGYREHESKPYGFRIVGSSPSHFRKDRRYIQIYVNRRRINDYSLTQAVEYGYAEYLPGGCYPMAFVFIDIPPDLVDFNIHPSKKEVRFRDIHGLHRALTRSVKEGLEGYNTKSILPSQAKDTPLSFRDRSFQAPLFNRSDKMNADTGKYRENSRREYVDSDYRNSLIGERISPLEIKPDLTPLPVPHPVSSNPYPQNTAGTEIDDFRYLGQIMDLFLLVEDKSRLLIIDQHAAHERILFDEFSQSPGGNQDLLVPLLFEMEIGLEQLFIENLPKFSDTGFIFEKIETGRWQLLSMPSRYAGMEDKISSFLTNPKGDYRSLEKNLNASTACRKAVKDGDVLDRLTAENLAKRALALAQPRCPHGRPVWFELTREELFRLVGRSY